MHVEYTYRLEPTHVVGREKHEAHHGLLDRKKKRLIGRGSVMRALPTLCDCTRCCGMHAAYLTLEATKWCASEHDLLDDDAVGGKKTESGWAKVEHAGHFEDLNNFCAPIGVHCQQSSISDGYAEWGIGEGGNIHAARIARSAAVSGSSSSDRKDLGQRI